MLGEDSTGHGFYSCAASRSCPARHGRSGRRSSSRRVCRVDARPLPAIRALDRLAVLGTGGAGAHRGDAGSGRVAPELALRIEKCAVEHDDDHYAGHATPSRPESRVLQDADRLDALGAVIVARAFVYVGARADASWAPGENTAGWTPAKRGTSAVGHFPANVFIFALGMHTASGRRLALERRHVVMEDVVAHLLREWDGEDRFRVA